MEFDKLVNSRIINDTLIPLDFKLQESWLLGIFDEFSGRLIKDFGPNNIQSMESVETLIDELYVKHKISDSALKHKMFNSFFESFWNIYQKNKSTQKSIDYLLDKMFDVKK